MNDAAYFDGTGFAEITFAEESAHIQRFEQEVKLLSHNGVLLLLQNGVKPPLGSRVSSIQIRIWKLILIPIQIWILILIPIQIPILI